MTEKSTREHLIDIGVRLMHRNGYNATGLKEILEAACVPKGSFYHYFNSKEDFAAAVLERYVTTEAGHAESVLGNAKVSPLKRLKTYYMDLIRLYGQKSEIPGCLMGTFSLEIAASSEMLRERLSASFAGWQSGIEAVLALAVAQKELPADTDCRATAAFLLNSWEGALVRSQADKSDAPLKNFIHFAFDVMLGMKS